MLFKIFDVGHGFCALAVAQNGNTLLFDCGHKADPEYRPSDFLPAEYRLQGIDYLFITNYDEDHISDLPRLSQKLWIAWLYRNPSLSPEVLLQIKLQQGPISPAMETLLSMITTYTDTWSPPPPIPGITFRLYYNHYPEFTDTNNLSLVIVLDVGPLRVLMPGDLELAGWRRLLQNPQFREDLSGVNVFVASHHGRENGYCPEIFERCGCRPDVVVFSDNEITYATQTMANTYARHARGISFRGQRRYVLSTRRDGSLEWRV